MLENRAHIFKCTLTIVSAILLSFLLIGCSGGGGASDGQEVKATLTSNTQESQDEEAAKESEQERLEEEQAAREAEEKARAEAEEQARLEAEERARIEAEEQARLEAEERQRAEAEAAAAAAAAAAQEAAETPDAATYVGNANSRKFHYPNCGSVDDMNEDNKVLFYGDRQELIDRGFTPCQRCNP